MPIVGLNNRDVFYNEIMKETDYLITDHSLWVKFKGFLNKNKIEFFSSFYNKTDQDNLNNDDSNKKKLIERIDNKITTDLSKIKEKSKDKPENEFQFNYRIFHKDILELIKHLLKGAIIFLKHNDRREKIHDMETFGIDELHEYFKKFIEFEEILYENIKFYRDHVFHVFRVFLLGLKILLETEFSKDENNNPRYFIDEIKVYDEKSFEMIKKTSEEYLKHYKENSITTSLNDLEKFKKKLKQIFEGGTFSGIISKQEKIAMWTIISLTHDLGYPLEKVSSINSKVREMLEAFGKSHIQEIEITFPQQGQFINDFVLKFISSRVILKKSKNGSNKSMKEDKFSRIDFKTPTKYFVNSTEKELHYQLKDEIDLVLLLLSTNKVFESELHIQSKYWLKFSRAFEDYNHSIISCILLMKYLVYFLESDYLLDSKKKLSIYDQRQYQIRREILRSIAKHNCDNIYHLKTNDFGFLLTIIDDLQCWGRPSGRISTHGLSWQVHLKEISEKKVSYMIRITEEVGNSDLRDIFLSHCEKYIKIFRGAVGGKLRKFDIEFFVTNAAKFDAKHKPPKYRLKDSDIILLHFQHLHKKDEEYLIKENQNEKNFYRVRVAELIDKKEEGHKNLIDEVDFHEYLEIVKVGGKIKKETFIELKKKINR